MPVGRHPARLRDRFDRTRADRRRSDRRRRCTLTGPAPTASAASRRCRMGTIREQSPRALLHADPGRPHATPRRDRQLAPLRARRRCGAARGLGMNSDGSREPGGGNPKPFWYLRRRSVKSDVDEELNLHLEMRIDELAASGMTRDEARQEAIRQFGDLEATRRYCRDQDETREKSMQRTLSIQDLGQDLRIGIRSLLRVPLLTLTIIATVGVGIGATAAIFSAVNAAMLRPLPYAHPDRLVRIYTDTPPFKFRFSIADYLAFTEQQTRFERHATYTDRAVSFSNGEIAELLRTRVVLWQFFSVLGI